MREANPNLVGLFVIGAIMLVVISLVLLSSQDLLSPKRKFIAYYQQSVNGLNIGAPVRFRGIPIGEVILVEGVFNPETGKMMPRLTLEVRPETMANASLQRDEYNLFGSLVENGMRASLKSASLLTGQLYVSLDFHPKVPVRKLGDGKDEYPEMPTIDSGFDEAISKLSDLPLQEVLARAGTTLAALESVLRDPNIAKFLAELPPLLQTADATLGDARGLVNNTLTPLLTHSDAAVSDVRLYVKGDLATTTRELSQTLAGARSALQEMASSLTGESLGQVNTAFNNFDKTLQLAQQRLSKDDVVSIELLNALREVGGAARSMRELADALSQNPESLLRGRSQ